MAGGEFSPSDVYRFTPILSFLRRGSASEVTSSRPLPFRVTKTYADRKYGFVDPAMSTPTGASTLSPHDTLSIWLTPIWGLLWRGSASEVTPSGLLPSGLTKPYF